MGQEGRLESQRKKQKEDEYILDNENPTEEQLWAIIAREEAKLDEKEPERDEDDCFEYKLVGVNVHSGTANQGHYWSYINTNREGEDDLTEVVEDEKKDDQDE